MKARKAIRATLSWYRILAEASPYFGMLGYAVGDCGYLIEIQFLGELVPVMFRDYNLEKVKSYDPSIEDIKEKTNQVPPSILDFETVNFDEGDFGFGN